MADDLEVVEGPAATIRFDSKKCIHSRHCVMDRPDVFVPNVKGAWIHPERASGAEILELAHNCPSGAISCTRHDGGPDETAPLVNTVRIRENGPLAFRAPLEIAGQDPMLRATLCRCGLSKNKPFCDSSHKGAFTATGEPDTDDTGALAARDGALTITPSENGPYLVRGNLEILSGTGRTIDHCVKAALCRCGHSHTKPFCDGTHKTVDFKAPGA